MARGEALSGCSRGNLEEACAGLAATEVAGLRGGDGGGTAGGGLRGCARFQCVSIVNNISLNVEVSIPV